MSFRTWLYWKKDNMGASMCISSQNTPPTPLKSKTHLCPHPTKKKPCPCQAFLKKHKLFLSKCIFIKLSLTVLSLASFVPLKHRTQLYFWSKICNEASWKLSLEATVWGKAMIHSSYQSCSWNTRKRNPWSNFYKLNCNLHEVKDLASALCNGTAAFLNSPRWLARSPSLAKLCHAPTAGCCEHTLDSLWQ